MSIQAGIPPCPYGPADDNFHAYSDDVWETETAWFSFNVPERKLGGWLYGFIRPNLGICTAAVFLYDDQGFSPWEAPFYEHQVVQPIEEERDLRDFQFPTGYSLKMLEPLMHYKLFYQKDDVLTVDLDWQGIMEPHPFGHGKPPFVGASHFDQLGHVTGKLVLHGETIEVDCYSMRDRSWGPRQEQAPPSFERLSYNHGCSRDGTGFVVIGRQTDSENASQGTINHGFWLKNDRRIQLAAGSFKSERDPKRLWLNRIDIEATDEEGGEHLATGHAVSHFAWSTARWVNVLTLSRWDLDGVEGWGEAHDVWQYGQWSEALRSARSRLKS
jgi:hypothetical protein